MGIFHSMVEVKNLAPVALNVRFDGQETSVPSGKSFLPRETIAYAMNQNPIMGTADAWNPNISGGKYLIVAVGSKYDRELLTPEEWAAHLGQPCRIDTDTYFADKLGPKDRVVSRGKGRATQARNRNDEGVASSQAASSVDDIYADSK